MRPIRSPAATLVAIALITAPVILSFLFVRRYAVDVVSWDQWELVPFLEKMAQGSLSFGDLRSQHNEHRIFFPRLVMLGLAKLSGYDTRAEIWAGWSFLVVSVAVLLWDHVQRFGTLPAAWLSFAPVAWLIMSLRQSHNLLWGWQLQITLCQCTAVIACVALCRTHRSRSAMAIALAAGSVASYSFASGLAIWPAGAVYLAWRWLRPLERRRFSGAVPLAIWAGVGATVTLTYFAGYVKPGQHPSLTYFLRHPLEALYFYSVALGGILGQTADAAGAAGTLLVLSWCLGGRALWLRKVDDAGVSLAVPFVAWSLVNAFLLLIGRSGFSADYGNASRYTTLLVLGVLAAYFSLLAYKERTPERAYASGLVTSLVVLGLWASLSGAFEAGEAVREKHRELRHLLATYHERTDAELTKLYPNPEAVRQRAAVLERLQLNVFRPPRRR